MAGSRRTGTATERFPIVRVVVLATVATPGLFGRPSSVPRRKAETRRDTYPVRTGGVTCDDDAGRGWRPSWARRSGCSA
ncbi:hypothetical protein GCM10010972_21470 [Cellulomonas carbonis]|uniref:Uncharacterized protein n=1 Tax=Cellulomonas carbonis T26 TaxID=947969 RepID=A0A0A0BMX1_9CELL|nr:hypothetical protein N868_03750 [Cellulomonas carbonis T26]GGC07904.1 hypothetical protein GCM10010972_21470 [Cellulomonas carbonis]